MALNHFKPKLFSGLQHFYSVHFAGITVEIEISPVLSGGGGLLLPDISPVYIRVTVKYKDKIWTIQKKQSYLGGVGLTLIKATFIRYELIKTVVTANLKKINNIIEQIIIKVSKK